MNPSEYRREFADYNAAVERERFNVHAGLASELNLRPLTERFADLWTRDAIEALRRAREETPLQFETERAGLAALAGAASLRSIEETAREVTKELGRCVAATQITWEGAPRAFADLPGLLATEADAGRRLQLARRLADAAAPCDDLRAARLEALDSAARAQGFAGRPAFYESLTGVDLGRLAAATDSFLRATEAAYMSGLSRWVARHLSHTERREPHRADEPFFSRASHLDARFPARDFLSVYTGALSTLGIRTESQRNLRLDAAERPGKGHSSACFALRPPEDVRLVVGAGQQGLSFYRRSFREVGRAQMLAWASGERAGRYPEFIYAPDAATPWGHGFLLSGLYREWAWVGERHGLSEAYAIEASSVAALLDLHETRRDCAALGHALSLASADDLRSERLADSYAALFTAATGFRYEPASSLLDSDEYFDAATRLRARLFAAGFAEHLRGRHGRRWYASRSAGSELTDVWNTASRYGVEELSRLLWGGELSFELLAAELCGALGGSDVG